MKTNINIKICAAVLLMMGLLPMLSSCDNEAVENSGNQRKIVFSSVLGEVSTRGTIATDLGGSIALMAYRYSGEWTGNTESPNFMYKEAATSLDNTNWTTATQYYWPNTSERMRFFGYAPVDAYDGTNGTLSAQSDLGPVTFSGFTVPTNIADQQDLLFGESPEYVCSTANTVSIAFHHILTAIQFSTTNTDGTIESIKFVGVPYSGTYTANTATGGSWTLNDLPASPNEYTGTLTGTFFMIPQTLPATAQVVITYRDSDNYSQTLTYSLSGKTWEMGKKYVYTINIADNEATLTPTVVAWTTTDNTLDY